MSAAELVELIDLSLGTEPCGVVNFNYLHGLLHEIVKRLGQLEAFQLSVSPGSLQIDTKLDQARSGHELDGRQALADQQSKVSVLSASSKERISASVPEGRAQGAGAGGGDASKLGAEQAKRGASAAQPTEADSRARQPSSGNVYGAESSPKQLMEEQSSTGAQLGVSLSKSRRFARSTASIVGAANSVGALERKLEDLESRMAQMESLPELLEKKASDASSTPVRDLWNYTNLTKRLSGAEEGVDKTSQLVDTLLGEVQTIKSQSGNLVEALEKKLSSDIMSLKENIDALQHIASTAKPQQQQLIGLDEATVRGMLKQQQEDYQGKIDSLRGDLIGDMEALRTEVKNAQNSLSEENKKQSETATAVVELKDQVNSLNDELTKLMEKLTELESSVAEKVNAADLESLIPKSDDGSSLLPLLLDIQQKVAALEANALPTDLMDQIESMRATINHLSVELSSVSSSVSASSIDKSRLDELGSQLAQFKERLTDIDRSVTAIGNAVSRVQAPPSDEELSAKYAGVDAFEELQNTVAALQQEQERLIGTAAHLSHELEVDKEHVKTLYATSDELKKTKADKSLVELEVQEKADRAALEGKASREWVDSTFERLDREIREAKSKLMGQEEAFKMAMSQINEDVDGKLDRNELEPLKEYFDKRLDRVKTAPTVVQKEISADEAAGFKKPLQFRCISCDRPVGIKPLEAIPALPSGETFPMTRSFRPYTTYELELIRKYQKLTYGGGGAYTAATRSAGGGHTMTRPHQRVRVAPPSSAIYTPETPPPKQIISVHDETDIVGNDGHIYKGRNAASRLPPLTKQSRRGPKRPTSSPHQQPVSS